MYSSHNCQLGIRWSSFQRSRNWRLLFVELRGSEKLQHTGHEMRIVTRFHTEALEFREDEVRSGKLPSVDNFHRSIKAGYFFQ